MNLHIPSLLITSCRVGGKDIKRTYVEGMDGEGPDAGKVVFTASEAAGPELAALMGRRCEFTATVRGNVFSSVAAGATFATSNLRLEVVSYTVKPVGAPVANKAQM